MLEERGQKVHAALGFDMVGIGYPAPYCICIFHGVNIRNSDEQNFAEKGWFTIRWAGMRTASDYLGYHQPWDTVSLMEATARSRANLEQGTENTFLSAYLTALVVDHLL